MLVLPLLIADMGEILLLSFQNAQFYRTNYSGVFFFHMKSDHYKQATTICSSSNPAKCLFLHLLPKN